MKLPERVRGMICVAALSAMGAAGCYESTYAVDVPAPDDGRFDVAITLVPAGGYDPQRPFPDGCGTLVVDRELGVVELRGRSLSSFDANRVGAAEFAEALLSEAGLTWTIREQHTGRFVDWTGLSGPPIFPDESKPLDDPLPTVEELEARYPRL